MKILMESYLLFSFSIDPPLQRFFDCLRIWSPENDQKIKQGRLHLGHFPDN